STLNGERVDRLLHSNFQRRSKLNKQTSPSTELDPRSHAEGERPPAPPESHVGASPSTAPAQADKARTERENQKAESRFQDDGGPSIHKNTQVETKPASQEHAISPLPGDEAVNEED